MTYAELRRTLGTVAAIAALGFLSAFVQRALELRRFAKEARAQLDEYETEVNETIKARSSHDRR